MIFYIQYIILSEMKILCMKCGKKIKLEFRTFDSNVAFCKKCKRDNENKTFLERSGSF
jgi:hypothetical protein